MKIVGDVERRGFPIGYVNVIRDYINNRKIIYTADEYLIERYMYMGVPQGSVFGPFPWNLFYDGILRVRIPINTRLLAFADDLVIGSHHKKIEELNKLVEITIETIRAWLIENKLELSFAKAEVMTMNKKKIEEDFRIHIDHERIKPGKSLKSLGVYLDRSRNFREHVEYVTAKAIKTATTLARLMSNTLNLKHENKTLFYRIGESVVLYAAPIWADRSGSASIRKLPNSTQKIGLSRIVAAYRSVPLDTLAVITSCVPWYIKVKERAAQRSWEKYCDARLNYEDRESDFYQRTSSILSTTRRHQPTRSARPVGYNNTDREDKYNKIKYSVPNGEDFHRFTQELTTRGITVNKKNLKNMVKRKLESETDTVWQEFWDKAEVGRWTYAIIPNIKLW